MLTASLKTRAEELQQFGPTSAEYKAKEAELARTQSQLQVEIAPARPEVQPHLVLQGHAGNIRIAFCDGFPMGGTALEFIEASDEIRGKFGRLKQFCNAWDGRDPIRGKV